MKDDSYCFLGLADITFKSAIESKSILKADQDRLLLKAYHKYLEVLAHDHTNCYASIGVANVLAFFNKTDDALEIYKLMSQSNPNLHIPLINQAHLNISQNKFEVAINLYRNVLERFKIDDLTTEMYLSKAYYRKNDFETCKNILLSLIARYPQHIPLKFNLALCLYE